MKQPFIDKLSSLKQFFHTYKRLPSYRELQTLWHVKSKNAVFQAMQLLVSEGYVVKDYMGKFSPTNKLTALTLYGNIPAGFPLPTPHDTAETMSLDSYLIEKPNATFLLKVSGDSLKDVGIMTGDLAIIEKTERANVGQIILACIDNEWTLKILEKQNGRYILMAANSAYPPFIPKTDLKIYGILKGVIRKYQ
ncbi:MAG: S24 family peptidase [Patescibacteria group bacterium]